MFYDEEMQAKGSSAMKKAGFPQGRLLYPLTSTSYPNRIVSTLEDGPFWYGDLNMDDLPALHDVATVLGRTLQIERILGEMEFIVAV